MLARPGKLRPEAEAQLDQITQMDGTLAQARELTHGFLDLIRHHSGEGLDAWLKDVRASTVREFLTFARSIERDKAAIVAGLTLAYSTGPWRDTSTGSNSSNGKPMAELSLLTCNTASCQQPNRGSLRKFAPVNREAREGFSDRFGSAGLVC
jgi:transposase